MNSQVTAPGGFQLRRDIMSEAEEAALIALIQASGLSKTHFSAEATDGRSTMSFLHKYDWPSQGFVPAPPMPKGFQSVAGLAAQFAGVTLDDIAHCALNEYEPGAWIEPHLDMPCWDRVVGVSLGSASIMTLSRMTATGEKKVFEIELPPRSMYLLSGDARHEWEHGVPPVLKRRWSMTFRTFSERGMQEICDRAAARRYA